MKDMDILLEELDNLRAAVSELSNENKGCKDELRYAREQMDG